MVDYTHPVRGKQKYTDKNFRNFATFVCITAKTYGPPFPATRPAQPFGHDRTHGTHAGPCFVSIYDQAAERNIVADGEPDPPHPGCPTQLHLPDRRRGTHYTRRSDAALPERRRLHRPGRTILLGPLLQQLFGIYGGISYQSDRGESRRR